MSGKFTQGEWKVVHRPGSSHDDILCGDKRIASIGQSTIGNPAEATANGHLIAAAPDLLAALTEMVGRFGAMQNPPECLDTARAAIAKAEAK